MLSTRYFHFKDHNNNRDVQYHVSDFPTNYFTNSIHLNFNKHSVGLLFSTVFGSGGLALKINHFPKDAEDELLNRYFFNLIKPTVGEKIDYDIRFRQYSLFLEHRYKLLKNIYTTTQLGKGITRDALDFSYYTSTAGIRGRKNFTGPLHASRSFVSLGFQMCYKSLKFSPFLFYNQGERTYNVKAANPVKSGLIYLEFHELGKSSFNYRSSGAGIGISGILPGSVSAEGFLTLGRKELEGSADFTTPVLGFEILPIAHQFDGSYEGEMPVFMIQSQFNKSINRSVTLGLLAEFFKSELDLKYHTNAEMEFGIANKKQSGLKTYLVNIYKLGLISSLRISGKWSVSPKIIQILPDIKEVKKKRPSAKPPVSGKRKKNAWGGTFYELGILYYF